MASPAPVPPLGIDGPRLDGCSARVLANGSLALVQECADSRADTRWDADPMPEVRWWGNCEVNYGPGDNRLDTFHEDAIRLAQ